MEKRLFSSPPFTPTEWFNSDYRPLFPERIENMKLTRFWLFLVACVLFLSAPDSYAASQAQTCPQNPVVQTMLDQVTQNSVAQWIRNFSGEDFVTIAGNQRKILTRFSTQLFNANNNALAFTYLGEQMHRFGYEPGLTQTDHAFTPFYYSTCSENSFSRSARPRRKP